MKYLIMQKRRVIKVKKKKKTQFYHDRGTNEPCINWVNTVPAASMRMLGQIKLSEIFAGLLQPCDEPSPYCF